MKPVSVRLGSDLINRLINIKIGVKQNPFFYNSYIVMCKRACLNSCHTKLDS